MKKETVSKDSLKEKNRRNPNTLSGPDEPQRFPHRMPYRNTNLALSPAKRACSLQKQRKENAML